MKCLIDMDGVLVDFVTGICDAHKRDNPYCSLESRGIFDMEKLWGITPQEFWEPINDNPRFWHDLLPMRDGEDIIRLACEVFGAENIGILSSPSYDPYCIPGKRDWVSRHYPFLSRKIVFANDKSLIASPTTVLLDDRDKNISDYAAAGGPAVTVPRLWNKDHASADCMALLTQRVLRFIPTPQAPTL